MYISHNWLKTYLPDLDDYNPEQIALSLTDSLAEVEGIKKVRFDLENIVAGEIISVEKHPKLINLSICKVQIEDEEKSILCGATNVASGQIVPVVLPGGKVYNSSQELGKQEVLNITEKTIAGIKSEGMICSEKELGISENSQCIMILESNLQTGTVLHPILKDVIYEIENKSVSHRSDCFSHKGIARELSAILHIKFQDENIVAPSLIPETAIDFEVELKVENSLCSRFSAICLSNVTVSNSPLWLISRLSAVGIRPVNNIVDATNYVMLELGQPLHAFDYDKVKDHKIIVRKAKNEEEIKLLNDKTYKLNKNIVTIANQDGKALSIAGIMGGSSSEVSLKTKNIILESANWNMYNIRKSSRYLGLRSEASLRFEKGLDPAITKKAIESAVSLIQDLNQSEVSSKLIDIYNNPEEEKQILLNIPFVKRFIGIEISTNEVIDILKALQLEHITDEEVVDSIETDSKIFKIPSFRRDLNIAQDLAEEVARMYGYDNIPATLPLRNLAGVKENPQTKIQRDIRKVFTAKGLNELLTYSFIGEDDYKLVNIKADTALKLKNPISPELKYLRNSIIPGLFQKVIQNSRNYNEVNVFEIGRIVKKDLTAEGYHNQPFMATSLIYDLNSQEQFFSSKSILEELSSYFSLSFEYNKIEQKLLPDSFKIWHPLRSALVYIKNKKSKELNFLGVIGELHPEVIQNSKIIGRVGGFEINIDELLKHLKSNKVYKPVSEFQKVSRDLSFWIADNYKYAEIINELIDLDDLITDVKLLDTYKDATQLNKISYTLKISLQSPSKTLDESEINSLIEKIISALSDKFKAKVRSK